MQLRLRAAGTNRSVSFSERNTERKAMDDNSKKKLRLRQAFFAAGFIVVALCFILLVRNKSPDQIAITTKQKVRVQPDWSLYENCTLPTIAAPEKTDPPFPKPLFVPSFPTAVDDGILRNIVNYLTGSTATVKSYYASSRKMKLKACHGPNPTLLCTLVHPMIKLNPPPDNEKFTKKFHDMIVLPIRNPATVFPSFVQNKEEKYHKQVGQMDEEYWRVRRDGALTNWIEDYKNQLNEWIETRKSYYQVGLYVPFEHLMEPERGTALVQKLATLLRDNGFAHLLEGAKGLTEQDYQCIWYHSVGAKRLRGFHQSGYPEYSGYAPGYTADQYKFMASKLGEFAEEVNDKELVQVLKEYQEELVAPRRMDVKATPKKEE